MLDIMSDSRYCCLRTMDEKKRAYAEWCERGRRAEDATIRAARKRLREDFAQLITEKLGVAGRDTKMAYSDVKALLARDPRFAALDDDNERAEVFSEYLRKREKEKQAVARTARKDEIARLKEKLQNDARITSQTQGRKVCDDYLSMFDFKELSPTDVVGYINVYIQSLDRKKQLEERLRKEENERKCRISRDAFRDLLSESVKEGRITLDTKWKAFKTTIRDEPRYRALKSRNYSGSGPEDLFEETIDILKTRYKADKELMVKALDGHKITRSTTVEDIKAILKDVDVPKQSVNMFSEHVIKHEAKSRKKLEQKFIDKLSRKRRELLSGNITFDEAERKNITYFEGLDVETRKKLFEQYIRESENSYSSSSSSSSSSKSSSSSPSSSSSSSSESLSPPPHKKAKSHRHHRHNHNHK